MKALQKLPTPRKIRAARQWFARHEPRALFYRATTELVDLALREATKLSVAEALAVLLQTWNRSYYRYHRRFDLAHVAEIEALVERNRSVLAAYRQRDIATLAENDVEAVQRIFSEFDQVLGQVGAAKALHLLAPNFFPLWDSEIGKAYTGQALARGLNGGRYVRFMRITKEQCRSLRGIQEFEDALKAVDEFNYYTFTRPVRFKKRLP